MSDPGRSARGSVRVVLGVLALLLLGALLLSLFVLGPSVEEAVTQAQNRAVDWTNSVLVGTVSADELDAPLTGSSYREVLTAVQTGIRSDERAVRVRIWAPSKMLIFSDDPDDRVGDVVATETPQIQTALDGQAASVTTSGEVPAEGGLAGSDEKLIRTFVPLRPDAELGVAAASEIDQSYDAVVGAEEDLWSAIRAGLAIALALVVVLFLISLVRRRSAAVEAGAAGGTAVRAAPSGAAPASAPARTSRTDERLKELNERLSKAEAAKTEAEAVANEAAARFSELEARLAEADARATRAEAAVQEAARRPPSEQRPRRGVPGVGAVASGAAAADVAASLQEAEEERERLQGEVARLRSALTEREAQLAVASSGPQAGGADIDELRAAATTAEELAAAAEARAVEAERRATEISTRAAETDQRVAALEGELRTAQAELAEATSKPKRGHRAAHTDEELQTARAQADELQKRLTESETALDEARAQLGDTGSKHADLEAANTRLVDELETLRTESARSSEELEALRASVAEVDTQATDERAAAAAAALAEVQAKLAEVERDRAELLAEVERSRQADAIAASPGGEDVDALRARVAELETVRRADVAELQRAQETLANTQFEATQARRQVKELEQELRSLRGRPEPSAEGAEEEQASVEPAPPPAATEEPVGEAPGDEAELSLRERLARAAAARHRMTGPPDGGS